MSLTVGTIDDQHRQLPIARRTPTYNLEIASAKLLEEVLNNLEGSVLCVSPERYGLDRITHRAVELDCGQKVGQLGGFSD